MTKKRSRKKIIIRAIIAIIAITLVLLLHHANQVALYDDESTTGNTSCNLLNGGLFCEADDTIYFSNPYDENMLYTMNTDLGNIRQLSGDTTSYLNIAGKYIFYTKRNDKNKQNTDVLRSFSTTGLYRMKTNGRSISTLYDDPTQVACLYGNTVYYQHYDEDKGLMLYAAKIDGSSDEKLLDGTCAPYAIADDTIYYTGTDDDHAIHALKTDGSSDQVIADGNYTSLAKAGEHLYCLDMSAGYVLKQLATDGSAEKTLISEQLATYNVSETEDVIYCQVDNSGDKNGLYRYDMASNTMTLIQQGNYNYLHLTSDYLFFEEYDQSKLYYYDLTTQKTTEFVPETKE